jgi:hypothetical protein
MTRSFLLTAVFVGMGCIVLADDPKSEPFRFGDDRGGKLLSQMLSPTVSPVREAAEKKAARGPASVEQPGFPSPTIMANVPRLQIAAAAHEARPGALPEGLPLAEYRGRPEFPQLPSFWTPDRVRVASVDVKQAMPLPVTARPVADRASLEDASLEASHVASLAAVMPVRSVAAPYLRFIIPNPFESREAIQSKIVLEEDPMPITSTPKLPR